MVRNSKEAIPQLILPLANWFIELKRLDLYNKSRVMGDYQARFCERLEGKFLRPTRPFNVTINYEKPNINNSISS